MKVHSDERRGSLACAVADRAPIGPAPECRRGLGGCRLLGLAGGDGHDDGPDRGAPPRRSSPVHDAAVHDALVRDAPVHDTLPETRSAALPRRRSATATRLPDAKQQRERGPPYPTPNTRRESAANQRSRQSGRARQSA